MLHITRQGVNYPVFVSIFIYVWPPYRLPYLARYVHAVAQNRPLAEPAPVERRVRDRGEARVGLLLGPVRRVEHLDRREIERDRRRGEDGGIETGGGEEAQGAGGAERGVAVRVDAEEPLDVVGAGVHRRAPLRDGGAVDDGAGGLVPVAGLVGVGAPVECHGGAGDGHRGAIAAVGDLDPDALAVESGEEVRLHAAGLLDDSVDVNHCRSRFLLIDPHRDQGSF